MPDAMTDDTPKVALTGAERSRLYRKRRRNGLRCIGILLAETEIDALIRKGLLTEETRHDPERLEFAVMVLIAQALDDPA